MLPPIQCNVSIYQLSILVRRPMLVSVIYCINISLGFTFLKIIKFGFMISSFESGFVAIKELRACAITKN